MKSKLVALLALFAVIPSLFAADSPAPSTVSARTNAPTFSNASPILFREGGAGLPPYPVLARDETPPARAAAIHPGRRRI
jgi:hypothetical protein